MSNSHYPRDLIGYGAEPPKANWPGQARIAVQFVLNYEEGGENCVLHGDSHSEVFLSDIIGAQAFADRHMSMESLYEYGSRAGAWRILREFRQRGLPLTVFGVSMAMQRHPDMVRAFIEDGHEIASHYNFHDHISGQDLATIERNLGLAIEAIYKACGKEPRGFRAPAFALPPNADDVYELIDRHFEYDSSFVLRRPDLETGEFRNKRPFQGMGLAEFPIVSQPMLGGRIHLRSGGTFWRLFSRRTMKGVMDHCHDQGFPPVVYLHPYDYLTDREFWVPLRRFTNVRGFERLLRWFRQNQWLGFGNRTTLSKLHHITRFYEHQGTMGEGLGTVA